MSSVAPTKITNKKKKKEKKKEKSNKTYEEREDEINLIKGKMRGIGLSVAFPSVAQAFKVLDEFVKTGIATEGKLELGADERYIQYRLTNRKNVSSLFVLKKKDAPRRVGHRIDPGYYRRQMKLEKKKGNEFIDLKKKNKNSRHSTREELLAKIKAQKEAEDKHTEKIEDKLEEEKEEDTVIESTST